MPDGAEQSIVNRQFLEAYVALEATGSKSSKATSVSDRQRPHLKTRLVACESHGRARRAKCWFA